MFDKNKNKKEKNNNNNLNLVSYDSLIYKFIYELPMNFWGYFFGPDMQISKAKTRWKTFYRFCIRSLVTKLMITQSYDCLRFSGIGT